MVVRRSLLVICAGMLALGSGAVLVRAQGTIQEGVDKKEVRDLKWYANYVKANRAKESELAQYEARLRAGGRTADANEVAKVRKNVLLVVRQATDVPNDFSGVTKISDYINSGAYKLHKKYMEEAKQKSAGFKALSDKFGKTPVKTATTKPTTPAGGGGAAGGGGGASATGPLEIYVSRVSGPVEFYINDELVHKGSTFTVKAPGNFTLRAVVTGPQRKNARDQAFGGANTNVESQNDHQLVYTVRAGNFNGKTSWNVDKEEYRWSVTREPNRAVEYKVGKSGKHAALVNDSVTFNFDRAFSFGATVSASAKWKAQSQRPGGVRTIEAEDKGDGEIFLGVGGVVK